MPKTIKKVSKIGKIHEDVDPLPSVMMTIPKDSGEDKMLVPSKAVLRCYGCGEFGNADLKRCACQCTYFCGAVCQRMAWPNHKQECGAIRSHFEEAKKEQQEDLKIATELMDQSNETSFICSVCLDEKKEKADTTITLPCGHHFCYVCIQEVAYSQGITGTEQHMGTCPQCRKRMPRIIHLIANRVKVLLVLADTKDHDKERRDEVCNAALQLLDFVLDQEPCNMLPRRLQGVVYQKMEKYDLAVVSYKQAYNIYYKTMSQRANHPGHATKEGFDKAMEDMRLALKDQPDADFSKDMKEVQNGVNLLLKADAETSTTFISDVFVGLGSAMLRSESSEDKVQATMLILLVQKINKPMAAQYNGCRPIDTEVTKALAECLLELNNFDQAKPMIQKAIQKFRYQPGFHKLMVECEQKQGNLQKALFYATKGYFYEEVWNQKGTNSKNLHLCNELNRMVEEEKK